MFEHKLVKIKVLRKKPFQFNMLNVQIESLFVKVPVIYTFNIGTYLLIVYLKAKLPFCFQGYVFSSGVIFFPTPL